ncbi:MAG: hypothetical protein AAGA30_09910, partial [Planctomycetota bacterium]
MSQNLKKSKFVGRLFYGPWCKGLLWVFLLTSPLYFWVGKQVLTPGDMSAYLLDVSHWLPQENQLIRDMERFSKVAGEERGSVIRIGWDGCQRNDPKLKKFSKSLSEQKWDSESNQTIFNDVVVYDDLVEKLLSVCSFLGENQVEHQLRYVLLGEDGT